MKAFNQYGRTQQQRNNIINILDPVTNKYNTSHFKIFINSRGHSLIIHEISAAHALLWIIFDALFFFKRTVAFDRYYLLFIILLCFVLIIDDLTG